MKSVFFPLLFFLLGVLAQMTILQSFEDFIADLIKGHKKITISMRHIGNQEFDIRNISSTKGIDRYPRLKCQTQFFQKQVNNLVEKIDCYKLTEFYDKKPRIQTDINLFCKNLEQINLFLQEHKVLVTDDPDGLSSDSVLSRIAKEIENANNELSKDIEALDTEVSHEIERNNLQLLPNPRI